MYNYNLQAVEWSRREIKRWYKANRYFHIKFDNEELVHRYTSNPKKQHLNFPIQAKAAERMLNDSKRFHAARSGKRGGKTRF